MMKRLFIITVRLNLLLSCGTHDNFDSFALVDAETYNETINEWIAKGEKWVGDPILITRQLFPLAPGETTAVVELSSQTTDRATVILTEEGANDDSVRGEKRIIDFERVQGLWRIKQIRIGVKCWDGRGHSNYSGDPCS